YPSGRGSGLPRGVRRRASSPAGGRLRARRRGGAGEPERAEGQQVDVEQGGPARRDRRLELLLELGRASGPGRLDAHRRRQGREVRGGEVDAEVAAVELARLD